MYGTKTANFTAANKKLL